MRTHQSGPPTLLKRGLPPLAVLCALGLGAIAYYTLDAPLTRWRVGLTAQSDASRACLAEGPELRRRHQEGKARLEALRQRTEKINRLVPDEPQEAEFSANFTQLADAHGVKLVEFRTGTRTAGETHSTVTVAVQARGSYQGLCQLVDGVTKLPRLVELTHMEIEAESGQSALPARFEFTLYYGIKIPSDDRVTL